MTTSNSSRACAAPPGGGYGVEPNAAKKTPTMHTLLSNVTAGLAVLDDFLELAGREVILSECDPDGWAAGSIHDNPNLAYRNSEYYASYVGCTVNKLMDLASAQGIGIDGMLTWAFQFENREYFEGHRTLSTNGIDKPVLHVFRLLGKLGRLRLPLLSDAARQPGTPIAGRPHPTSLGLGHGAKVVTCRSSWSATTTTGMYAHPQKCVWW